MKNTYISIAFLLFGTLLSSSLAAQELEGEWQIKTSTIIGLLDTTVLFSRNSPDNVIDLSAITYQFNADGSYEGTDIWGNPVSGTWSLSQFGNTLSIDDELSSLDEINDNEVLIYFPFQPFSKSSFTSTAGSYLVFVRTSPNGTSSAPGAAGMTLSASPNPFTDITIAEFTTAHPLADTRLEVFNARGQRILSRELGYYPPGSHQIHLDISSQSVGMYFLVFTTKFRVLSARLWKQ